MAAPKKNKFWEKRSKNGRDKLLESPEILWDAACEYFSHCIDNPLYTVEYNGGKKVTIPKMQAFTWSGLELFLDISTLRHYKTNPDYAAFKEVCDKIEKVMYTQKFTGAAAGLLHYAIISRDLGLADKHEHTGKDGTDLIAPVINVYNNAPPMAGSEEDIIE